MPGEEPLRLGGLGRQAPPLSAGAQPHTAAPGPGSGRPSSRGAALVFAHVSQPLAWFLRSPTQERSPAPLEGKPRAAGESRGSSPGTWDEPSPRLKRPQGASCSSPAPFPRVSCREPAVRMDFPPRSACRSGRTEGGPAVPCEPSPPTRGAHQRARCRWSCRRQMWPEGAAGAAGG